MPAGLGFVGCLDGRIATDKIAPPKSGVFLCFCDRILEDHETKARDPETVPTQHYEKN